MRKKIKILAALVLAASWWGVFYPELCFTEATCEAVTEDGPQKTEAENEINAGEIWRCSGEELVISSRFLEWWEELQK